MDKIRWGILGTGRIAKVFAQGLNNLSDAELVAIGSRSQALAEAFGQLFTVPHRHSSYESLVEDSDVDIVYVATPHSLHSENSMLALKNGKAVLCEKPFTINASEAEELITYARKRQLFLMEAMWTRFLPAMVKVRELLSRNAIGDVRMVTADFGFRANLDPQSRIMALDLGGGALLDVGVYTVSFASMILGKPSRIVSMAHLGETGVDEQSAMILGYIQGELAILYTAVRTTTMHEATIMGTQGCIRIHAPFYASNRLTLREYGKEDQVIDVPYTANGFNYEAFEVMRCIRAGLIESPIMPLDESLEIMQTMDQIRSQWGLNYPTE